MCRNASVCNSCLLLHARSCSSCCQRNGGGRRPRRVLFKWKQLAGYAHKRRTGELLWQPSYYDHVLRDDEETSSAVRYVLENPVRKGLVKTSRTSHLADPTFSVLRSCG